ncbi:hypothetical protein SAMN04489859_10377 [Paracoccus alcaliphilus]|uniref:Uncharacterized protein n=1 Tax=Paracoccus alcaliphilus TaxID=34002 RepID=A0A1H8M799_9RHOB|nr:hypothetical protein [Paracoccus alcaliphilus]WCR16990.1 hypothetical protein JHW40_11330 [Paracoccus alcaliphilus]SEO13214.1 hypothetical protein SAMN04489859_10377 [Paracoccus alcaliphilus]
MTALEQHIQNQQNRACQLVGVLEAIATLDNEGIAENAVTALIHVALDIAREVNDGLDSAALPKGGAA